MKKLSIVYHANGENAGTNDPIAEWKGQYDLDKTVQKFMNWDCNILVDVKEYTLAEVEVPDWMDAAYYLKHNIILRFLWAYGLPKDSPQSWYDGLIDIDEGVLQYAVIQLIKSKPRVEKRKAWKQSLIDWFEGLITEKELGFKLWWLVNKYNKREYDSVSTRTYWSR